MDIDIDVRAALERLAAGAPAEPPPVGDWRSRRAAIDAVYAGLEAGSDRVDGVETADFAAPSADGHQIPLRLYRVAGRLPTALVVHLHGGGMIAGSIDGYDQVCRRYAVDAGVAVLAVAYRLAPEFPFPTPVEDCVAAVEWAVRHVAEVHLPGERVVLMGDSAGGGLAAATALACRDRGVGPLHAQVLIYPMLDDRTSAADPAVEPFLTWTAADNVTGWQALLGDGYGHDEPSALASAARARSLRDLPRTYVEVGQLDLFRDESIAYAKRLMDDEVSVHLVVRPGVVHGYDRFAPDSRAARAAHADRVEFLRSL
ncbi:alpha/beta hydrolase [Streptomyces sulfonofaciens]|uniref:Alpha/beta hydrolase n=1 Tax=Streptomyces sulfonofaciens TaxID=68272 RepID=A0A919GQ74_9ACTN|nr:alpha/beta hydrolase [Streptomyces sulfonofaciens]GHH88712.1 alpha/beta hydrolase [Streptomyces sulfonofaciens]